jgi:hypothetical protein
LVTKLSNISPETEAKMLSKAIAMIFALTFAPVFLMYVSMAEAQIVTDGLISYWTFDEADIDGDIANDIIGVNDGNIIGAVEVVEGKTNQGLLFSGGHVDVLDDPSIRTDQFSIQFWLNSNLEFGPTSRFELVDNTGNVVIRNDERAEFGSNLAYHWNDGAAWQAINPADVLSAEEWYNVAVTHDASEARLYVNGSLEDSLASGFVLSGESGLSIGAHKWAAANFFDGIIDEVLFYGKVLTEAEVLQNYDASGLDVASSDNKLFVCWGKLKASR